MSFIEKTNIVIYRVGKKGLEVFLTKTGMGSEMELPKTTALNNLSQHPDSIELDAVSTEQNEEKAFAVEADWHELPSLKKLLKEDLKNVAGKIISLLPDEQEGSFVAIKDAFRKVMPNQYAFLKELKDIIKERNSIRNI